MKLSISNIGWDAEQDEKVYAVMREMGYVGLEIAPTRIFGLDPYSKFEEAKRYKDYLKKYGLCISSMQSIWYGKTENIFNGKHERENLYQYTKKAIDFAEVLACKNLVFGCPKNRNCPSERLKNNALDFFKSIGQYAEAHNTVFSIEANPSIYNTNYINYTEEAFLIAKEVDSPGCKVNLDFGSIICNKESLDIVKDNVSYINHIHISEPWLKKIQIRSEHQELEDILKENDYQGFVSIEMGRNVEIENVFEVMNYIREVFG